MAAELAPSAPPGPAAIVRRSSTPAPPALSADGAAEPGPRPPHPAMVEINVGGRVFATGRATLCRSPVLALLFAELDGGRIGVETDDAGRIFLDRDPDLFARVLYFLRHRRVHTDDACHRTQELLQEFDYLQIEVDPSRLDTSHRYYSRLTWNAVQDFIQEFMAQVRPMLERAAKRGIPRLRVRLYRTQQGKSKECIMWMQPQLPCFSIHNDIWYFSAVERPDLWRKIGFCTIRKHAGRSLSPMDHVEFFFTWPLEHPFHSTWDDRLKLAPQRLALWMWAGWAVAAALLAHVLLLHSAATGPLGTTPAAV